ncbi:MAG: HD domain-containing phosphohydrolase [Halanaerobiales bacterium]
MIKKKKPEKMKSQDLFVIDNPAVIGLKAAEILSKNFDDSLIYEKTARFLFESLEEIIEQLHIYIIDEQMKNLKEEVIYTANGWRPGYDVITLYQLPREVSRDKDIFSFEDQNNYYLMVPLSDTSQILGMIELKTKGYLSGKQIGDIKIIARAISLGLSNILFKTDTLRIKRNTDTSIEINSKLQAINEMEPLISTFMEMIIRNFRFDRITTFLINQNKEIVSGKGINEKGEFYTVDSYPELPDLSEDYIAMDNIQGYWFPLKANTGIVGVVLFDNMYTLYNISDLLLDTLRILCSQFANAIDNLILFSDLQESAYFDTLTGLHNRTYLDKVLPEYDKEENLPLSVIIGDLNGLKVTNDVFGHTIGDQILQMIANIFKDVCSKEDLIVRWGGDEFVILLPGKDTKSRNKICREIKKACQAEEDSQVQLSVSLGYSTKIDIDKDIELVMKEAEDIMYRHKLLESKSFRSSLLDSLKETLMEKCYETAGHAERMAGIAEKLGYHMELMDNELDDLKLLAMLHDIGKVAVDDHILNKPGPLNRKELQEVMKHSEAGYRIAHASFELSQIANYILAHHERWDGKGYPLGKAGCDIPLLSRIIAVVDAYDVMTHDRPYRKAMSHREAVEELRYCAGTEFDPDIIDIFCKIDIDEIVD